MSRLIHLSDLHFGTVDPQLRAPLLEQIAELNPALVAVSGDLTQRARHRQFAEAQAFLAQIPAPVLSVPGNHDTPLDNLFVRFIRPFGRYKRHICPDLEPVYEDDTMIVIGVNTVNRFAWQSGKIGRGRLARLAWRLRGAHGKLRVAVLHHPLEHAPGVDKRLMRGADQALAALSRCGADVVLSGHLHHAVAAPSSAVPDVLFVQAGTGLSTRLRNGQRNSFNQIDAIGDDLRVVTWTAADTGEPRFVPGEDSLWTCHDGSWAQRSDTTPKRRALR
ncbi:metallophosphoesterase family protein [Primorskyibacter sp. 2E107]|uniref:metallophosphoesterase family protein n=1 Tax=Primorskyibacter sp. 2E107 TaxID=3403458 RepID=UPI003AF89630